MTDPAPKRPPVTLEALWFILRETFREWNEDKVPRLAAAQAFYSMLGVGPLLLIVISLAGLVFGRDAVAGYVFAEVRRLIGDVGAQAIQTIVINSRGSSAGIVAIFSFVALIISTIGYFAQLQDALNTIWNVEGRPRGDIMGFVKKRLLSFAMIGGIGFLLLTALVVSAGISAVAHLFAGSAPAVLLHLLNLVVSFAVITLLFAMIFKVLPDVDIRWRDVWIGSGLTALLFSVGKYFIGLYLGRSAFSSTYGAAGSLIVVLVWIYYSTQIFFIGAEFTQVYARYMGEQIIIKKGRRQAAATKAVAAEGRLDVADCEIVNVAKAHDGAAHPEPKL